MVKVDIDIDKPRGVVMTATAVPGPKFWGGGVQRGAAAIAGFDSEISIIFIDSNGVPFLKRATKIQNIFDPNRHSRRSQKDTEDQLILGPADSRQNGRRTLRRRCSTHGAAGKPAA